MHPTLDSGVRRIDGEQTRQSGRKEHVHGAWTWHSNKRCVGDAPYKDYPHGGPCLEEAAKRPLTRTSRTGSATKPRRTEEERRTEIRIQRIKLK